MLSGGDVRGGTGPGPSTAEIAVFEDCMAYKKGYVAYKCHHLDGEISTLNNRTSPGLGCRLKIDADVRWMDVV